MAVKIDLHIHSRYSFDCSSRVEDILQWGKQNGVDVLCITDHHSYLKSAPISDGIRQNGLVVLRGAEATTNNGHFLIYGVQDDSWNCRGSQEELDAQRLIDYVNALGGVVIAAHPFRKGGDYSGGWRMTRLRGLVAIETWNNRCTDEENQEAVRLAQKMGLPMVGGSDAHIPEAVGTAYSLVEREIRSLKDLVQALKQGLCRMDNGGRDQKHTLVRAWDYDL